MTCHMGVEQHAGVSAPQVQLGDADQNPGIIRSHPPSRREICAIEAKRLAHLHVGQAPLTSRRQCRPATRGYPALVGPPFPRVWQPQTPSPPAMPLNVGLHDFGTPARAAWSHLRRPSRHLRVRHGYAGMQECSVARELAALSLPGSIAGTSRQQALVTCVRRAAGRRMLRLLP